MSGGNCPETPRQKMIGMMYLFLTAMLALNVSGELLKAFILVDQNIQQSVTTVEKKNSSLYYDFSADASLNPRAAEQYKKAEFVKIKADSLAKHILDLKIEMMHEADGSEEATLDNFKGQDNQDVAAQIMIVEKIGGRSKELKRLFAEYEELLLGFINPEDTVLRSNVSQMLNTKDSPDASGRSWESEKFEHLPLSASFALMSKMIGDVRNSEADVLRYLYSSVDESSIKFTSVEPLIIPRSDIVIRGGEYSAQLIVAGQDENLQPEFTIPGISKIPVKDGRGALSIPASSSGEKTFKGNARILGPDGWIDKAFEVKYEVIDPMVVISPTKMNVFYEAVENPITVSVPGANSKDVSISISNATYKKVKNEYLVTVTGRAGQKCVVTVSATIEGKKRVVGNMDFRIKRIPPPIAKVAGINEGKLAKNLLIAQSGVVAEMDDFDFELEYRVTRFNVSAVKNGYSVDEPSSNNRFTDAQRELIKGVGRGSKVFINDINAEIPGKDVKKKLGSITITLD